jgi:cyanate lyase
MGHYSPRTKSMEISATSLRLLTAKRTLNISFAKLGQLLEHDEVWVAALFYGQASATPEEATKLLQALQLPEELLSVLVTQPSKGLGPTVPVDPLIYRFYEIMQVYGEPIKAVIHEKFGDGIMSAIDFTLKIDKVPDPQGDRVQVTMNGKFLPYKKW